MLEKACFTNRNGIIAAASMKGVTRGIILVLLAVFAVIKAETSADESVAPHENTPIGINNAEDVAENPVEDDREDERIPTQEDKGITLRT